MRTSETLLALLLLAGCSPGGDDAPANGDSKQAAAKGAPDRHVLCRIGSAGTLQRDCLAEQEGALLTLRDPTGGFRRFRMVPDGRGLVAADGAREARVTILSPREIEVAVDGSVYRLPARMASGVE